MEKIEYTASKDHEFSIEHFLHPLYLSNADQFIYYYNVNLNSTFLNHYVTWLPGYYVSPL